MVGDGVTEEEEVEVVVVMVGLDVEEVTGTPSTLSRNDMIT